MARPKVVQRPSERYRALADLAPSRDSAEFLRALAERHARDERPMRLNALARASRLPGAEFRRRFEQTRQRYGVGLDTALDCAEAALAGLLKLNSAPGPKGARQSTVGKEVDVPAPDRSPRRTVRAVRPPLPPQGGPTAPASGPAPAAPGRFASPGQALHAVLGALKVGDHYAFASAVLGREVASLAALDREERLHVQEAAEAAADRRRAA